ncbi:ATP-binding protein [Pedobacter psychroterrae]|uniref:histidine kinase n=1 Tax=Pedobacter psychroterrae TaxID=2530453 RepID=A0A4R0NRT5_9SPHI|nr:ATP-binding protein [Pedobacter psychroterrae]TCD02583.1 response regulator [Pedobacter psychroterrae]
MKSIPKNRFIKTIKSKVIIALLLACFALFMAWGVSKVAFNEMLSTVENISAPSERLRMVNVISRKIGSLDQVQKNQAFNDPNNYRKLFRESVQLRASLDTLAILYQADSMQLGRITTIRRLLSERDKQFINYLKVRERLVNNKSFSEQVRNLNDIVSKSTAQTDSTVLATVEKTSTTTIYPEEKPRGFFSKLFGKKKNEPDNSFRIVSQEKIKRDTIALSSEEQMAGSLKKSIRLIEQQQQQKNASFLNREAVLAEANSKLVVQMLDVLRKVEIEVVNQIEANGIQAKKVVNTGISTISVIMLVFMLLTGLLLYLILTDITQSSRYRNELELAKDEAEYHGRAKQRFLSNMSHEIRTPLQSIIGYAEIIRHQDQPEQKDIDAIYHSSEHLLQIVNEVLDYNRIISGKFTFSNKAFNISELLEEVLSVMRPQAELKSLKMRANFDTEGLNYIEGDPFRLKQILYNLLGNAIKFTESGEVSLSVFYKRKSSDLHFTFVVRDTGIGISEDEGKRIFNEFEQVNAPGNEVVNGMGAGLGLTIIKSLVEQQGGRIYLKSKPNEGSVFTVYLTFRHSSKSEDAELKVPENGIVFKDKVWVVDDDPLILDLCGIIFNKNSIDYESFQSPAALLAATWDTTVKYVLMDMRMPEMNGIELCSALREKINSDVKIFAITAQVLPDERAYLLKSGFDGLVMKPFRENELLAILKGEKFTGDHIAGDAELDLSSLKKMTYGDQEQLTKVLLRFKTDCLADGEEIRQSLKELNLGGLQLLTHRLAGRIAQIGAKNLAGDFRACELELRAVKALSDTERQALLLLLTRLDQLLIKIDRELHYLNYSIS